MPDGSNDLSGRVGLDTTDFKTGLATMNRELRVLESSFRASAAGLGDWASDASGLELRIKSLTGQIDIQQQKVEALEAEYKRVAAEKGENSRAAQELEIKLNKENETLGKMNSELGKTETALSDMGEESGDAAKQTDKLEGEENDATGSTNKFAGALSGLKGKLGEAVGGLKSMIGSVAKVAAGLAVGLVGAAAGAAAGLAALVIKSAATADELAETSEKLGISTTKLQELNYIAEQTGTGVDTMTSSMSRMIRSLESAEKAGSPTAQAFSQLGVNVRDSNGQLRDSEAIFFDAVSALGSVGNETERDVLAMTLFGKSAMELNPLINLGTEGMAAMSAEAQSMGAIMGEDAVTGLANLNDSLASVKAGFTGLLGTLATAFLPIIQGVMEYIKGTVIPWLQENLPKAIQVLTDYWTTVLQPALTAVWTWLSTVLIPFFQDVVLPWLQDKITAAIQILSNFWTGILQPAIQAVWNWMSTVLIPFLRDTVKPWLDENIPKALQVLSDFWTGVLQPAIKAVWNWISTVLIPFFQNTVVPWLQEKIPAAIKTLSDFWNLTLLPAINKVWEFINTYLMPIFNTIKEIIGILLPLAITALKGAWENILLPALKTIWDYVDKYITPALTWLKDNVVEPLTEALTTGLKWALDKINEALGFLKDLLKNIKLPDWLVGHSPSPFEKTLWGINDALREMTKYNLPALSNSLSGFGGKGALGGSISNNWNYVIQAANPLQTSDDLARQVRLLELMH